MRRKRIAVSERLDSAPPGIVAAEYAEEIMRLRKAMNQAVALLYEDKGCQARRHLSAALAERWWK